MRNFHRGRDSSQWFKKTSNFLSPGTVKNQELLSRLPQISTFGTIRFYLGNNNNNNNGCFYVADSEKSLSF